MSIDASARRLTSVHHGDAQVRRRAVLPSPAAIASERTARARAPWSAADPTSTSARTNRSDHGAARGLPGYSSRPVRFALRILGWLTGALALVVALGTVAGRLGALVGSPRPSRPRSGSGCGCRGSAHAAFEAGAFARAARRYRILGLRRGHRSARARGAAVAHWLRVALGEHAEAEALLARSMRPRSTPSERAVWLNNRAVRRARARSARGAGADRRGERAAPRCPGAPAHARHGAARGRPRRRRDRRARWHARRRRATGAPRGRSLPRPIEGVDAEGRGRVRRGLSPARRRRIAR